MATPEAPSATSVQSLRHTFGSAPDGPAGLDAIVDRAVEEDGRRSERRQSGNSTERERPGRTDVSAPADRDTEEDGDVNDVVAPEVEHASPARLLESQAGQLAVAPV